MCLSVPSKIISLDAANMATVECLGVSRQVSLDLMDQPAQLGDYVLIHVGFAMTKLDEADALASIALYQQALDAMDAEEQALQSTIQS